MIASLKAEFRKIFTIRSTLIIFLFCVLMIGLFAFYGQGVRFGEGGPPGMGIPPVPNDYLMHSVRDAVNALGLFIALIGLFLITHEYRYNTIMYTLTSTKSRSKTLAAKIIATSVVALLFVLAISILSPLGTYIGLGIRGAEVGTQVFYYKDLIWQVAFYGWGFAMAGLLFGALIRNQIGAIVTLLLYPTMVESLLSIVLKDSAYYLPFLSLGSVVNHSDKITEPRAAMVFLIYLVIGWIAAFVLFIRRDAN